MNMGSLEQVRVSDVQLVRILIKDEPTLISHWRTFYGQLELDAEKMVALDEEWKRGVITVDELFLKIIRAWSTKFKNTATIQKLIDVLKKAKFRNASDRIRAQYGYKRLFASQITMVGNDCQARSPSTSTDPNNRPPNYPIWYNFEQPKSDLITNRTKELESLGDKFQKHLTSTRLTVNLITGKPYIGKSELARHFAFKMYKDQGVSVIWINGSNIENELMGFMSGLGIKTRNWFYKQKLDYKMLSGLSNEIVAKGYYPWLIVFDGINKESATCLKLVVDNFRRIPPRQNPFVIITSRNDQVKVQLEYPCMRLENWLDIENSEHLQRVMKLQVSPWVEESCKVKNRKEICSKVDGLFHDLFLLNFNQIQMNQELSKKFIFGMFMLISYVIGDGVEYNFLSVYCNLLSVNGESEDKDILELVLGSCIKCGLILRDSQQKDVIKCLSTEVKLCVKEYLKHSGIKSIIVKLFRMDIEMSEVTMVKWLLRLKARLSGIHFIDYTCNLLNEIVEDPCIINELRKEELLTLEANFTDLRSDFIKMSTLKAVRKLGKSFRVQKINKEAGDVFKILYELRNLKYGNVDHRTLLAGRIAAGFWFKAGRKSEGIVLLRKLYNDCQKELGPPLGPILRSFGIAVPIAIIHVCSLIYEMKLSLED